MKRISLTLPGVVLVALAAGAVGAASSGQEYGVPRAMPSDYAAAADSTSRAYGLPRALPSDYRAASRPDAVLAGVYGMPRALPSDYPAASLARTVRGGDYGMPRALPADYAQPSGTFIDLWAVTLGAAALLAALALGALVALSVRGARRPLRTAT